MQVENKKFKIVTLGCRTNQYESQAYHDQLVGMGYAKAGEGEAADLCIVNTCTVTESADKGSRQEIRQLARKNPGAKLVVTGCSAERAPQELLSIGGVTHVVANKEKEQLLQQVFPELEVPEFAIQQFDAHTRAFVKVQDGCNSFCTYCIIPYVRGRSRSRSVDDIVREVEGLIANGFQEVVLTGINVGDFDGNKEENPDRLADLVRIVDKVPGLRRLRISSIDPDEVDDNLMDAVLGGRNTCPSFHIVLQSGSNAILKRMNRKYTRQIFMDTIEKLRKARSDFTFTTDVIVGFPGETEFDFKETLAVMEEVQFAKVHMFPYSARPRTRAATYPNQVPADVIRERKGEVLRVAEQTAFLLRNRFVGMRQWLLTEKIDPQAAEWIGGHSENFLPILIPSSGFSANQLIEVELLENSPNGLIGRPITRQVQCA